ncbi:MAG: OmpA family protein [Fluviicola sp.]|nr:OmpA family protein [Fluviicola sp.]
MKFLGVLLLSTIIFSSCVPVNKYNELLEKEKLCADELNKYKTSSLNFEAEATDLKSKHALLTEQLTQLRADTSKLGGDYRTLYAKYDRLAKINESLETSYNKLLLSGAKESAHLHADLHRKQVELQEKEDALLKLEQELLAKQSLLAEREQRVNELEKIIHDQEEATRLLKEKVSNALKGFANKGLKVEERNGKIYVSLEAKLLFSSGSTNVEGEGRNALIDLAKVLETEKDLEIIVEGHTDTDKMAGTKHPKNNWELSVLRSTSVIEIMLENSTIDPTQLMAAGRSEFIPVDVNDKAKNRRIEIIISPNLNELYELIGK